MHDAAAIDRQRPRTAELPRRAAGAAPDAERFALQLELLHPAVLQLHHVQGWCSATRTGDVVGIRQLAAFAARSAEAADEFAVGGEDLDAMVARVGDVEVAVGAERHGTDAGELADLGAGRPPTFEEFAR